MGIATPRWLIYVNENPTGVVNEHLNGIVKICQRLYRQGNTDQYSSKSNTYMSGNAYICFNYLFKWHNASINGPELLGKLIRSIQHSITK